MYSKQEGDKFGLKSFPDPLADHATKSTKAYGLTYAKAIESQWGSIDDEASLYRRRLKEFERNRDYANGTQDTSVYKQILTSLDPNAGDGSLLNIDWRPVPIVPKFVNIVVNKILSRKPYPNLEAVDPLSQTEKDGKKNYIKAAIKQKPLLEEAKKLGLDTEVEPDQLPDTPEEVEIFMDSFIKTDAEVAAQLATEMTLEWNDFNDSIYRRCVEDLVNVGLAVTKRDNDPNYGITEKYVDPISFIHSFTEDPNMNDIMYCGYIRKMTIQELKRIAGDQFTEDEYKKIAMTVRNRYGNSSSKLDSRYYDKNIQRYSYGYDEYTIEVLDFEYKSTDEVFFEDKETRFGNRGFYYKGYSYKEPKNSVYERKPSAMNIETLWGGKYIIGTDKLFDYCMSKNVPRNVHDISKCRFSFSFSSVNLRRMIPKSMTGQVIGFADMLQITHLKLQQSIAKAKPDGLIIDVEGLENVQLGKGGELQPLEIQDIYEQTGVFYYRSKNPEGGFQNPPVREIGNSIRNINELIGLYNHYLRMIRDSTGINEVMDGSSPKGDQLVGVRQQAMQAGNNAIYGIENASMILYKKVCQDIVKALQILPPKSVVYQAYEKAIGKTNMKVVSSFRDLPMYNFGVLVNKEMDDTDKAYLEQNIQVSLSQKELDIEDAINIRNLKDVNQAERLLIVRRKKRMKALQEQAAANSQAQAQANVQSIQAKSQADAQMQQIKNQGEAQLEQLKAQLEAQRMQMRHEMEKELKGMELQMAQMKMQQDQQFRQGLEMKKDDRKDERVAKQAVEQSKLISQRQGKREELSEREEDILDILTQE